MDFIKRAFVALVLDELDKTTPADREAVTGAFEDSFVLNVRILLSNGWTLVVFNDCVEWDYIDSIEGPFGTLNLWPQWARKAAVKRTAWLDPIRDWKTPTTDAWRDIDPEFGWRSLHDPKEVKP